MPRVITEDSTPRELWVTYLDVAGNVEREHGEPPNGAIDSALFGSAFSRRVQILDYGVALWGHARSDSRTVIPWARVLQIEEVF